MTQLETRWVTSAYVLLTRDSVNVRLALRTPWRLSRVFNIQTQQSWPSTSPSWPVLTSTIYYPSSQAVPECSQRGRARATDTLVSKNHRPGSGSTVGNRGMHYLVPHSVLVHRPSCLFTRPRLSSEMMSTDGYPKRGLGRRLGPRCRPCRKGAG